MQKSLASHRHRAGPGRGILSNRSRRLSKLAVRSVLAPPKQQTKSKPEAPAQESSIWRSASQLVTGLRIWPPALEAVPQVREAMVESAPRYEDVHDD